MLGFLCNQTVNLEADAKTLYYSLLKKEITRTGHSPPKNLQIDRSFFASSYHELFCVLGDFYVS